MRSGAMAFSFSRFKTVIEVGDPIALFLQQLLQQVENLLAVIENKNVRLAVIGFALSALLMSVDPERSDPGGAVVAPQKVATTDDSRQGAE